MAQQLLVFYALLTFTMSTVHNIPFIDGTNSRLLLRTLQLAYKICDRFVDLPLLSIYICLDEIITTLDVLLQAYFLICNAFRRGTVESSLSPDAIRNELHVLFWKETVIPICQYLKNTVDGSELVEQVLPRCAFAIWKLERLLGLEESSFAYGIHNTHMQAIA